MGNDALRILCLGDVVGEPGRRALTRGLPLLRREHDFHLAIVNGENAAGGLGIDAGTADEIFAAGADVITLGDHTWQKKEMRAYLDANRGRCIRPANYPAGAPGTGCAVVRTSAGIQVGVMNLLGRVFFNLLLDCPFGAADRMLGSDFRDVPIVLCDMHAEATSEKVAMGKHLAGRASCVFGTHTHVQTADERILNGHTGYITDLGMCGASEGVIGMDAETALARFKTGLPQPYKVSHDRPALNGIVVEVEVNSGKALSIIRVHMVVE